jgi:hypothetical protein
MAANCLDKITKYNDLLSRVNPLIRSSIKNEKYVAYDFGIIINSAINKYDNDVLLFLHDGIDHAIEHFMPEFLKLVDKKIVWEDEAPNVHFDLLHDVARVIMNTMIHKNNLEDFRDFLLQM